MVVQTQSYSIDEFIRFITQPDNKDRLLELINGEMVEKVPTELHGLLATLLSGEIYVYLKSNPIGRVMVEVRHQLPESGQNSYLPDVAFTSNERALPVTDEGAVPIMPDLAVEIASPGDNPLEMRTKALYYLKHGSRLVWLLFPRKKQIEVHTLEMVQTLTEEDHLNGDEVLPGFTLAIKTIFGVK